MAKDPFKEISNFFKKIGGIFKEIQNFFVKVGNAFKAIGTFFTFLGNVFKSIFSYITCGFKMIITLPVCFKWYSLEILGKTLYSPIGFLFFFFSVTF
jgi:phage-related protein